MSYETAAYFGELARENHPGGLPFQFNDGGRASAGFRGMAGDCVTRALAIALDHDYRTLYDFLSVERKAYYEGRALKTKNPRHAAIYQKRAVASARNGVPDKVWEKYLASAGWVKVQLPRDSRLSDLPTDRVIVAKLRGHLAAVDHGVIQDSWDSSLGYDRLAFSYWEAR